MLPEYSPLCEKNIHVLVAAISALFTLLFFFLLDYSLYTVTAYMLTQFANAANIIIFLSGLDTAFVLTLLTTII